MGKTKKSSNEGYDVSVNVLRLNLSVAQIRVSVISFDNLNLFVDKDQTSLSYGYPCYGLMVYR